MKNKPIGPRSIRERCREINIENPIAQQSYGGGDEMGVNIHSFVVEVQQIAKTPRNRWCDWPIAGSNVRIMAIPRGNFIVIQQPWA